MGLTCWLEEEGGENTVNEHQLMREPVCEELVEECSGRKGQGMLILGGGCGRVCFRVGSNGPV